MIKKALSGRRILVVAHDLNIVNGFHHAFRDLNSKVTFVNDEAQAWTQVRDHNSVDIIIVELDAPALNAFSFLQKMQTKDLKSIPVFLIAPKIESYFDLAFFEGAEGIFIKPLVFDDVLCGIAHPYSGQLDRQNRQHERRKISRARIEFLVGKDQSIGFATNISSRGLFVGSMGLIPNKNEQVSFRLTVANDVIVEVSGVGVVRWIRPAMELGRPRGFGIEILGMNENNKRRLALITGGLQS